MSKAWITAGFALAGLSAYAQSYRLNYQPKEGSTVRYEIAIHADGNLDENPFAPRRKSKTVLRATATFTDVSAEALVGEIKVKLISTNAESTSELEEWRKGYEDIFEIEPHDPLLLIAWVFPETEDEQLTASDFIPLPALPNKTMRKADFWDVTSESLSEVNGRLNKISFVDLRVAGQAVTHFLGVDSRGFGTFETRSSLVRSAGREGGTEAGFDQLEFTEIQVDMATAQLESLDSWGRVEAYAKTGPGEYDKVFENLTASMQVRRLK